jgi:MFS family permease
MAQAVQTAASVDGETRQADSRRWFALAVVHCGAFLVIAAASVVNLAIPSIRRTMNASFGQIQLVIAGYTMVYAIFLILGGRLGDRHGRKRVLPA